MPNKAPNHVLTSTNFLSISSLKFLEIRLRKIPLLLPHLSTIKLNPLLLGPKEAALQRTKEIAFHRTKEIALHRTMEIALHITRETALHKN